MHTKWGHFLNMIHLTSTFTAEMFKESDKCNKGNCFACMHEGLQPVWTCRRFVGRASTLQGPETFALIHHEAAASSLPSAWCFTAFLTSLSDLMTLISQVSCSAVALLSPCKWWIASIHTSSQLFPGDLRLNDTDATSSCDTPPVPEQPRLRSVC